MGGRRVFAQQSSHLPLKVNMAGVIPPIFASSILLFPASLGQWFGQGEGMEWLSDVSQALAPSQPLYIILFAAAVVFFCFFYTALMYNPKEVADNLKRSGAFIPGIRPGDQTAKYIDGVRCNVHCSSFPIPSVPDGGRECTVLSGWYLSADCCSRGDGFHGAGSVAPDVPSV